MAYSELIKDFSLIRSYMRQFFVYGFRSRRDFDEKSARSYDNERRRVESWLGDYMAFRHEKDGKRLFIAVDSRTIAHNPLYQAFKAKTFTDKDITLHFLLLDALSDGSRLTSTELVERIETEYFAEISAPFSIDESTVRRKLREYETLGLLKKDKDGRRVVYFRDDTPLDLARWRDALALFSEVDPLGFVGSTLLDKLPPAGGCFAFKHHYILRALETEILFTLVSAIDERRAVRITRLSRKCADPVTQDVLPLRIRMSASDGRYYLLGLSIGRKALSLTRIDRILTVTPGEPAADYDALLARADAFAAHLWGASHRAGEAPEHVEMVIHAAPFEQYVVDRLMREKRCGHVEQIDKTLWRFTADVWDAMEMLPWLRTFMGRVVSLTCTNETLLDAFRQDTQDMLALYGGEDDDLS